MAGYVDDHLLEGETIVYGAKVSPIAAFMPAIVLGAVCFGLGFLVAATLGPSSASIFFALGVVCEVFAIPAGFLRMRFAEFAVTNRRVISKDGVLRTHSLEINLNQVESTTVHRDIPGRLFGYGSIVVTGTGGSHDPFKGIDRPFELRSAVQRQLEVVHQAS